VRGGTQIFSFTKDNDDNQISCTAGFNSWSRSDGKEYVMTAGHCLDDFPDDRSQWGVLDSRKKAYLLGSAHRWYYGDHGDLGIVEVEPLSDFSNILQRSMVYVARSTTGSTTRNPHYRIRRTAYNQVGRIVCMTGATTGSRCGEVKKLNTAVKKSLFEGRIKHLGKLYSCGVKRGDSGGPIIKSGTAYGMIVSKRLFGCNVYFQGAKTAENELNVSIVP
jgi:hypothetical protein